MVLLEYLTEAARLDGLDAFGNGRCRELVWNVKRGSLHCPMIHIGMYHNVTVIILLGKTI